MKQLKNKMLVSTLATALTLGGSFTGIVHSAFADDTSTTQSGSGMADSGSTTDSGSAATTQSGSGTADSGSTTDSGSAATTQSGSSTAATPSAPTASTSSDATLDGVSIPVFAKVHGVDLRLGKAALSTAIILSEDIQNVYDALSQGSTLSQIGMQGASDYQSQLISMTQVNIDAAVSSGNLTPQQASRLSSYASNVLNSEINDANYRDYDNSSGDNIASTLLSVEADSGSVAQLLGMTQGDLNAALSTGKSLGAIAESKGISVDKLVTQLESGLVPDLQQIIWGNDQAPTESASDSATSATDTSSQ